MLQESSFARQTRRPIFSLEGSVKADCFCSIAGYLVDGGDHWATRSGVIYALSSSERTGDC